MLIVAATVAVSLVLWLWVPERSARPSRQTAGDHRGLAATLERPGISPARGVPRREPVRRGGAADAVDRDLAARRRGLFACRGARGLLAVNVAMILGYLGFGRAADAWQRRGRNTVSVARGRRCAFFAEPGIARPRRETALAVAHFRRGRNLGCAYVFHPVAAASEGYGRRANTAINVFGFVGMFSGQWGIGLVLDLWPPSASGYAAAAYPGRLA